MLSGVSQKRFCAFGAIAVAQCCVRARVMWLLCSAVFFKVSQNENISSCTSGDNVRDRQQPKEQIVSCLDTPPPLPPSFFFFSLQLSISIKTCTKSFSHSSCGVKAQFCFFSSLFCNRTCMPLSLSNLKSLLLEAPCTRTLQSQVKQVA